jgi:hypothetical protein
VQPISSSVPDSTLPEESNEPLVDKNGNMKKELVKRNHEKASMVNDHNPAAKATATTFAATVPMTAAVASNGSSISEYLTKECPGWHVEDLFIDDAAAAAAAATVMVCNLSIFLLFKANSIVISVWANFSITPHIFYFLISNFGLAMSHLNIFQFFIL